MNKQKGIRGLLFFFFLSRDHHLLKVGKWPTIRGNDDAYLDVMAKKKNKAPERGKTPMLSSVFRLIEFRRCDLFLHFI